MAVCWTEKITTKAGDMYFPKNDEWVLPETKAHGEWEGELFAEIESYLPVGGTFIDAGAFVGNHTIRAAQKVGPSGQVLAFEPQRLIHQVLCCNVVINNLVNVRTHNIALGHKSIPRVWMSGKVYDDETPGMKSQDLKYFGLDSSQKVNYGGLSLGEGGDPTQLLPLDNFLPDLERVDVIKADIQGSEPMFFWGAREVIKKFMPVIFYESDWRSPITTSMRKTLDISPEVEKFNIAEWAQKELGYRPPIKISPWDFKLIPPYHVDTRNVTYPGPRPVFSCRSETCVCVPNARIRFRQ